MKFIDRSQLLAIFLTITLYVAFLGVQASLLQRLYGYEPYIQKFFADHGEPDELFNQRVDIYSGQLILPNTSLLRTTTYTVSEGGMTDSDLLYTYGAVFLRGIFVLLVMMIVIAMTNKVQYALVTGLICFTSPFFVFRSTSLIPENVSVLFFLLLIWGFEQYKRTGRIVFMPVVIMAIIGNIIYYPNSVVMNLVIVFGYVMVFLFNEDPRKIEVTLFTVMIALILLLPMFDTIVGILGATLHSFGDNSVWELYTYGDLGPDINSYFELIGYPTSIFAILGIVVIVRWQWRKYLHLLVMLACILFLMVELSPRLFVDPARMQTYLYLVLLLIVGVYMSVLFTRTSRFVRMMLISIFVAYGIATMLTNPPWQRITLDELAMVETANQFLAENSDEIIYVDADAADLSILIEHPKQLCAYYDPIFQWYVPPKSGDVPDCTGVEYIIASNELSLPDYRIVDQTDDLALYQRIVDVEQ